MSAPSPPKSPRSAPVVPTAVLLLATVLFATATALPLYVGVGIAAGSVLAGTAMQRYRGRPLGDLAAVPVIGALAVLAAFAPSTAPADLLGGVGAVAILFWLAGEPGKARGSLARAVPTVMTTGLILVIAWTSALLLPRSPALLGIGGALLVALMLAVAILLGRPDLIDGEPPATA